MHFNRLLEFKSENRDKDWQVQTVIIAGTRYRAKIMVPVLAGRFCALALPVPGGGAKKIHICRGPRGGTACLAEFLIYLAK